MKKNSLQVASVEDLSLLRNSENYLFDLNLNNVSETGIVSSCVFSKINTFDVWDNVCPDIMHDMLEGVFNYNLSHIFHYFINEVNYFTIDILNMRKSRFDYGFFECGNLSENITIENIKNKKLNMNASEMMCFIKCLPLMIGDLIPNEDDVWNFFLLGLKIFEIASQYEVELSDIEYLKSIVEQHNNFYVAQFKDTLKPKHHFLVHYARSIEWMGPLRHLWCMRFEGENRNQKLYAGAITSRKNLQLSICRKEQLKFAYRLLSEKGFSSTVTFGPKLNQTNISIDMVDTRESIDSNAYFVKWVSVNNIRFEKDCVLHVGNDTDNNQPNLVMLEGILSTDAKTFYLIVKKCLSNIHYNYHFRCFVSKKTMSSTLQIITFDSLTSFPTTLHYMRDGNYGILLEPLSLFSV